MIIRIKNLRLRAVVGVNDWERTAPQEILLNIEMEYDGVKAAATDSIADTVDYKALKLRIMDLVEGSHFALLEKLAQNVLDVIRHEPLVTRAKVEIDKPAALRFADSVSVEASFTRSR